MSKINISRDQSDVVRGWAILAVVLIHVLAYFPGIFDKSNFQWLVVALDQTARFCVPAFLIISGYGLSMKYGDEDVKWGKFVWGRVKKLLPLYFLWSVVAIVLMRLVPEWVYYNQPKSILIQLLFGQADYQMYFLPLILQLYLLFPLIWKGRKYVNWWLVGSLILQIGSYFGFGRLGSASERFEYVVFISWVFYFVVGIWLARKGVEDKYRIPVMTLCMVVWWVVVRGSVNGINSGVDPLLALKFTRVPALIYGSLASLSLLFSRGVWIEKLKLKGGLVWLGKNSYLIFLAHTMGLRLIYGLVVGIPSTTILMVALVVWLGTIVASKKLLV